MNKEAPIPSLLLKLFRSMSDEELEEADNSLNKISKAGIELDTNGLPIVPGSINLQKTIIEIVREERKGREKSN